MDKIKEKGAIFRCDRLNAVIYGDMEPEAIHRFFKNLTVRSTRIRTDGSAKLSLPTLGPYVEPIQAIFAAELRMALCLKSTGAN